MTASRQTTQAQHRATFPANGLTDCTCGGFTGKTYVGWKRHAKAAAARGETVDNRINPTD